MVLERGAVAEYGTHAELLAKGGIHACRAASITGSRSPYASSIRFFDWKKSRSCDSRAHGERQDNFCKPSRAHVRCGGGADFNHTLPAIQERNHTRDTDNHVKQRHHKRLQLHNAQIHLLVVPVCHSKIHALLQ